MVSNSRRHKVLHGIKHVILFASRRSGMVRLPSALVNFDAVVFCSYFHFSHLAVVFTSQKSRVSHESQVTHKKSIISVCDDKYWVLCRGFICSVYSVAKWVRAGERLCTPERWFALFIQERTEYCLAMDTFFPPPPPERCNHWWLRLFVGAFIHIWQQRQRK